VIGIELGVCNLVALPLGGASTNPARSLRPAVFEGGTAMSQFWVLTVLPLIRGPLASAALPLVATEGRTFLPTV
jgi:aquaporin Z